MLGPYSLTLADEIYGFILTDVVFSPWCKIHKDQDKRLEATQYIGACGRAKRCSSVVTPGTLLGVFI